MASQCQWLLQHDTVERALARVQRSETPIEAVTLMNRAGQAVEVFRGTHEQCQEFTRSHYYGYEWTETRASA